MQDFWVTDSNRGSSLKHQLLISLEEMFEGNGFIVKLADSLVSNIGYYVILAGSYRSQKCEFQWPQTVFF